MSSKQLARTVVDGRRINLTVSGLDQILSGYLCGMDDFHYLIITPDCQTHLIHKGSAPAISLGGLLYESEGRRDDLEKVVGPFRTAVQQLHLAPHHA